MTYSKHISTNNFLNHSFITKSMDNNIDSSKRQTNLVTSWKTNEESY